MNAGGVPNTCKSNGNGFSLFASLLLIISIREGGVKSENADEWRTAE